MQPQPSNDRRISTEWFSGIPTPEERAQFEQAWRNSTYVLDQLKSIIQRKMTGLDVDKPDDYDNPSWAVKRADRNGELRALKEILRLLP